ncbi:hypothetical protein LCGC14_2201350 [marine sediment metagenome]|uniref:Uncharacterized protein n=1 Tax=marine sediment metagenome TaxID=412755 RepID=A0A0F9FU07_9ZZZZ
MAHRMTPKEEARIELGPTLICPKCGELRTIRPSGLICVGCSPRIRRVGFVEHYLMRKAFPEQTN